MRDNKKLIESLSLAMTERLDDPKNVAKGDFPTDFESILELYEQEAKEVIEAIDLLKSVLDRRGYLEVAQCIKHLRSELADLSVCSAFFIQLFDGLLA
jgi:NTP pyrophosphatase (non-canonical NTP hydrolase)